MIFTFYIGRTYSNTKLLLIFFSNFAHFLKMEGISESKNDISNLRDLIFYINDVLLIAIILKFLSQSEIRCYSHSSKSNREITLKLGLIKYMLSRESSRAFYQNGLGMVDALGRRISNQVSKGVKITSLNLWKTDYEVLDENILGPYLEKLTLWYCFNLRDVSNLGYVRELELSGCRKVRDVGALGKVYRLLIGGDYENPVSYEGIEALSNVHELGISNCTITDVSPLSNIHNLTLWDCPNLTDISPLSSVQKLKLGFCQGIIDVDALHTVSDLTLHSCHSITDVSRLSSVPKLKIINCEGITNWGTIKHDHCGNSI